MLIEFLLDSPVPRNLEEALATLKKCLEATRTKVCDEPMTGTQFVRQTREAEWLEEMQILGRWLRYNWRLGALKERQVASWFRAIGVKRADMPDLILRLLWRDLNGVPRDLDRLLGCATPAQTAPARLLDIKTPNYPMIPDNRHDSSRHSDSV